MCRRWLYAAGYAMLVLMLCVAGCGVTTGQPAAAPRPEPILTPRPPAKSVAADLAACRLLKSSATRRAAQCSVAVILTASLTADADHDAVATKLASQLAKSMTKSLGGEPVQGLPTAATVPKGSPLQLSTFPVYGPGPEALPTSPSPQAWVIIGTRPAAAAGVIDTIACVVPPSNITRATLAKGWCEQAVILIATVPDITLGAPPPAPDCPVVLEQTPAGAALRAVNGQWRMPLLAAPDWRLDCPKGSQQPTAYAQSVAVAVTATTGPATKRGSPRAQLDHMLKGMRAYLADRGTRSSASVPYGDNDHPIGSLRFATSGTDSERVYTLQVHGMRSLPNAYLVQIQATSVALKGPPSAEREQTLVTMLKGLTLGTVKN